MGTNISGLLLSRQGHGAEDGNQDQDRSDFEGQQQVTEEDAAEVGGSDQGAATELRVAEWGANGEEDVGEQAEQRSDAGETDDVGGTAAARALLFTGIEQHDDEGEEHHDGT